MRARSRVLVVASLLLALCATAALKARAARSAGRTGIVAFEATPFPYLGNLPDQDRPFLDAHDGDRAGHTSPRGGIHWGDVTYASRSVLLSVPRGFDPRKPFTVIVFFHGNNATLERDVWHRQQVVDQVARSHLNAVLVAPQFAVDAPDSSAGNFWRPGFFAAFLAEAASRLATFAGDPGLAERFAEAPVLVVAYSGGYNPVAFALNGGGADDRICGVILLDALFGETARYTAWLANRREAFFVSTYSKASQGQNLALQAQLQAGGVPFQPVLGDRAPIERGAVAFVPATQAVHNDFVTAAWTASPLRSLLSRVRTCQSGAAPSARGGTPLQAGVFTPEPVAGTPPNALFRTFQSFFGSQTP